MIPVNKKLFQECPLPQNLYRESEIDSEIENWACTK